MLYINRKIESLLVIYIMECSLACNVLTAFVVGYLPGAVVGLIIWFIAKRSAAMPVFPADAVSFIAPIIVWGVMYKYNWTLAKSEHNGLDELVILGWIWSLCVIGRLLIPRFTHKLRFRLAAIHIGSICIIAAILLALFYQCAWN